VIVNTADRGGGAERIAMTMLDGFQALGTETWLAVGAKHTDHPRVMKVDGSPHVDYSPHHTGTRRAALAARRQIARRLGLEDFEHPYSRYVLELTGSPPDLVLCENLHGGWFDLRVLPELSLRRPLVLRLADSWTFTGHCACPLGCPRWETGCGRCPDLEIPPAIQRDATRLNWRRKRRIFSGARLFLVAPSRWLMDRARRSLLAPAIAGTKVVPNGVDLGVFTPGDRGAARRSLRLDGDRHLLLYVSNGGDDNPYKDFATIRAAVTGLQGRNGSKPIELLVVGGSGESVEELREGTRIHRLPYCDAPARMAELYRAADAYVHAAPEEAFCLTAAEALACGTPVVAAAEGGIDEVVDHGRTGLLSPPGRPDDLAAALLKVLGDPASGARMGEAGARTARDRFDRDRMVTDVHAWCAEVAAEWRGPTWPRSARSRRPRRAPGPSPRAARPD
jgi:glycosyltransferase involved in cell wall biosynthesis